MNDTSNQQCHYDAKADACWWADCPRVQPGFNMNSPCPLSWVTEGWKGTRLALEEERRSERRRHEEAVQAVLNQAKDDANHPSHYTFGQYEVIDVLDDWFPTDPYEWTITKYVARAKHKGQQIKDLKKAQFYLNRRIEQLEMEANRDVKGTDEGTGSQQT